MTSSLTSITVDLRAIDHNIRQLKKLLPQGTHFMAVVKSNGYGHGLFDVAKQAISSGADSLAVVSAPEAIQLRRMGIIKPILVLGGVDREEVKQLIRNKVAINVFNEETYRMVYRMATITNQKAIVHIKVDTGLNRIGFSNGDVVKNIQRMVAKPRLFTVEGIHSHLANKELNLSYTKDQIRSFEKILKKLSDLKINIPLIAMASSAGTIMYPETHFNCVRAGMAIYGIWPSRGVEAWAKRNKKTKHLSLKPALSFKTKLIHVHRIPAGALVGYGSTFQARQNMTIGVIPVGYYEGIDRSLSNMGFCLIKGSVAPIIGIVSMNMTILDLSKRPRAKVGDEVVIIGSSQNKRITATDIGDWAGTTGYEIITRLPDHIDRYYRE